MKLTKAERAQLAEHVRLLEACETDVRREFTELLAKLADLPAAVNRAIEHYNVAAKNAEAFCAGIAEQARDTFDDKSERWQEGDAGQALDSFAQEWEAIDLRALPKVEIIEPELERERCESERLHKLPTETESA